MQGQIKTCSKLKKFPYSSCTNEVSECYVIGEYVILLNTTKQNIQVSVEFIYKIKFGKFGNTGACKNNPQEVTQKNDLIKMESN